MTIKMRLVVMTLMAALGMAVIFVVAKLCIDHEQQRFSDIADNRVPKMNELHHFLTRNAQVQRDIREFVLVEDEAERKRMSASIAEKRALNKDVLEFFKAKARTEQGLAHLADIVKKQNIVSPLNQRIINLAEAGDQAAAIALLVNPDVRKANTEYRQAIEAFVDYQVKVTHEVAEAAKAESEQAKYGLMMGSIILIIMMVLIALFISRRINSLINGLVTEITAIAKGMRFNQRLTTRQDEFDMVAVSLNQLLSQVEQGLQETNRVMAAIADGDFSERMKHEYAGDMALLKTNTNNSAGEIASVMQQITKAMNALKAGYFSVELSRKAPGDYGVMLTNTATAFSEISAVIKDINQRMSEFKAGKLDQRVTVASSGELKMLGNSVNETLETIGQLTGDLVRLANAQLEGDLTQSSTGHYEGVYKELVEARVRSSERIKEVLNHATRTAYVVSTASEQVANGAGDLSQRVQQQAAALEETSATMNEIATTVQNNTENAQQVAKLSNDVKAQSLNGVAVMQKTINAIQSISESSQKINEIVTLIDGIAFQTNLLALNAAVEAARAGEHGRGFAVVAGEVRALAQKSSEAASDIKHLINESVIRVEAGTELAERSGVVLNQISDSITSVASMVGQIAEASHEQAIGISQVHKALIDIDRITQENATLVEDTTSSAENLRTESTMLSDNLAFFNTGAQLPVEKAVRKSPVHAKKTLALPPTSSHTEWSDF